MSSHSNQDTASASSDILYGRAEDNANIVMVLDNKQDAIDGLAGNDIIIGDLYSDQVSLAEDVLHGGAGADWLFGDTVNFSEETLNVLMKRTLVPIILTLDDGKTVDITGDVTWRTREYTNTARDELYGDDGNDHLFGGAGSDVLKGGAGHDYLDGGTRADDMAGGTGNDTYFVDDAFDRVDELNGSGFDTVVARVSFSLDATAASAGVEKLFLAGFNSRISGTGNAANNILDGAGNAGSNTLIGLDGNDKYIVGAGDKIVETVSGGTDTVQTYQKHLHLSDYKNVENGTILSGDFNLFGSVAANRLIGSADANRITGGQGRDVMTGGGSADVFVFNKVSDTGKLASSRDVITDFKADDTISLILIDANSKAGGNQAFDFIGFSAFHKIAGELHAVRGGSKTIIEGDVNGDRKADFQIELHSSITLHDSNFDL